MKNISALCLALMCLIAWNPVHAAPSASSGKVLHLNIKSLELLLSADPNLYLVDVRTPEELTGPLGKISQSRNVPLQDIEKNPEQFPREKTLVLICRTGHRSMKAANLLADHGYVVYSVDEGMQAWRQTHPLTESKEGDTPIKPGAPAPGPDAAKPQPPEKEDRQPPEKNFFDNKMGC